MAGRFDYKKVGYDYCKKEFNNSGTYSEKAEKSFNNYLRNLHNENIFNRNLWEKGIEFFNLGGTLEDALEEYKNDYSFVTGYNYAKRLAKISEIKQDGRKK